MIELTPGNRPWQKRARALRLQCHCGDCLREAGITAHGTSDARHRNSVLGTVTKNTIGQPKKAKA